MEAFTGKLSLVNRFLALWIFAAMILGVAVGSFFPGIANFWNRLRGRTTNILIAAGLILMMYPPLAKGNNEYATGLVAFNSLFLVFFYSFYAFVFLAVIPSWLGLKTFNVEEKINLDIIN